MINYFKDLGLIYENMNTVVIGYHGSYGNKGFDNPNIKGIWFAEDKDSDILDYYSNRGNGGLIKAELKLGQNLDLSMYNADEMMDENYAHEFITDMGFEREDVDDLIDIFYFSNFETDYDDNGDPVLAASVLLNYIIENKMIPNRMYDSITILEGNDHITHCILDKNNIRLIN